MVEWCFCVCLTNIFRFYHLYSCTFPALLFRHSDLILPWLECLGVVVTSGSQSCGWWWGRRSSLLFYPDLHLFLGYVSEDTPYLLTLRIHHVILFQFRDISIILPTFNDKWIVDDITINGQALICIRGRPMLICKIYYMIKRALRLSLILMPMVRHALHLALTWVK